jgi:5-methyltetrahydropteroyltriglutamate--homocysteine methyltransferase
VHELDFLRTLTGAPIKVALPGPYLLTRTMWMDCIADSVYATREEIAADIVRVLREEIMTCWTPACRWCSWTSRCCPRWCSAAPKNKRSFMCGALSESEGPEHELAFAQELVNAVVDRPAARAHRAARVPRQLDARRVGGAGGSYAPLIPTLAGMRVGAYLLEACTPRAGDMALLQQLPPTHASASAW